MPRYYGSVFDLAPHSDEVILGQAILIQKAIRAIHSLGFVHMDIKLSNFFAGGENQAQWYLGDFGSAVGIGKAILSYSVNCHPEDLSGRTADPKYDWAMFAFALITESRSYNSQDAHNIASWI